MSNTGLIIEERAAKIGNFLVGRILPFRGKRMVGPFIFIDHMGPSDVTPDQPMEIGPHPHIGLSTLTYLLEGKMQHHDSLGVKIEIQPGEVNWMTAGKGISHSERTPLALRNQVHRLHGLQLWVALPKALEEMDPSFFHADSASIPTWESQEVHFKLIAGEWWGRKSPVPVYSPLYFVEIKTDQAAEVDISEQLYGEVGLYILQGEVEVDGEIFDAGRMLVAVDDSVCKIQLKPNTIIYLFGGEAFPEERFIDWNFVSSSLDKINAAKEAWNNGSFPLVPGENDVIHYPLKHQ